MAFRLPILFIYPSQYQRLLHYDRAEFGRRENAESPDGSGGSKYNSTMVKNRVFRKLANIAYLIETVNKGAKLQIVLEYDGNFYYRVQVIEEDGIETFLMYLNESVYASVQSLLGCSEVKTVAAGKFDLSHSTYPLVYRAMPSLKRHLLRALRCVNKNVSPIYTR